VQPHLLVHFDVGEGNGVSLLQDSGLDLGGCLKLGAVGSLKDAGDCAEQVVSRRARAPQDLGGLFQLLTQVLKGLRPAVDGYQC
jgi:hypothetical protein